MRASSTSPRGAKGQYSNYGYLLASAVVEKLTGIPFFDYIKEALLQPAGITDVIVSSTTSAQRANDERSDLRG